MNAYTYKPVRPGLPLHEIRSPDHRLVRVVIGEAQARRVTATLNKRHRALRTALDRGRS